MEQKGMSGRSLAPRGNSLKREVGADLSRKRDDAKKIAKDKIRARTLAKQQQLAERVASASEQLASGIEQGSKAAELLNTAMNEISSAAEESSGASEESRSGVTQIEERVSNINDIAKFFVKKIDNLKSLVRGTTIDTNNVISGVNSAMDINIRTMALISDLEKQAEEIGGMVQAVVRIADQTNLLALNAAIEAARAGEYGRGFAVVADEVRILAETSEVNAREIKEVVGEIQGAVKDIVVEVGDVSDNAKEGLLKGEDIAKELKDVEGVFITFSEASSEISIDAESMLTQSSDLLEITETIASASEQLATSCEQSRKATQEQTKAFADMSIAAEELSETSDEMKNSTDMDKSAQEIAAMAEELSANVEESSSAAQEVASALEQLRNAVSLQMDETENSLNSVRRLGVVATGIEEKASNVFTTSEQLTKQIAKNKIAVDNLIVSINIAGNGNITAAEKMNELEEKTRKIEKIVEVIANVTIQTNMLAVSGSIEAARAGEHGRGFVVVAGDIRNLANESAENADKIKDRVKNLQYQIVKSTNEIELAARTSLAEAGNAKESSKNFGIIDLDMKEVLDGIVQIKEDVVQAVVAVEQIQKGIEQINVAAKQATGNVEDAAGASEEQARGLQDLSQAIEEVASIADEMQLG